MKSRILGLLKIGCLLSVLLPAACWGQAIYSVNPNWMSPEEDFTTSVALADLNGDGDLDLITACYDYPYQFNVTNPSLMEGAWGDFVYVYEWNNTTLTFDPGEPLISPPDFEPTGNECIAVADYDGDGDMDIAVGVLVLGSGALSGDGKAYILQNNSTISNLDFTQIWTAGEICDTHAIRWVDIDCDGDLDLATLEVGGILRLYPNDPDGFGDPIKSNLIEGSTVFAYEDQSSTNDDDISGNPQRTALAGTTMEFGDIDSDGDMDLFVDIDRMPLVLKNLIEPNTSMPITWEQFDFFNPDDPNACFPYNPAGNGGTDVQGHEQAYSASFGYYHGAGSETGDTLALAVGSFQYASPLEMGLHGDDLLIDGRGNNIYTLYQNPANTYGLRNVWISEYVSYTFGNNIGEAAGYEDFQMVTDIQWADLNNDNCMDLVSCSYPTADNIAALLNWKDGLGREKYYLANPDGSLPMPSSSIWTSDGNDLSTSLALGDINGSSTVALTHIGEVYNTQSGTVNGLIYLPKFPAAKVLHVYRAFSQSGPWTEIPPIVGDNIYWCADPLNGWASIDREYLTLLIPLAPPQGWSIWAKIEYSYATQMDLAIGNDGKDVVYYYGGGASQPSTARNYSIATYPASEPCDYPETYDEATGLANGPNMDEAAPIGFHMHQRDSTAVDEFSRDCPDVQCWTVTSEWGDIEMLWRHFYWNRFDKILKLASEQSPPKTVILFSGESPAWTQGDWEPLFNYPAEDEHKRPCDEKLSAYFTANLINRYRPGGLQFIGWGVETYSFVNEPNCETAGYGWYPQDPANDDRLKDIAEKMYRNYQMLHGIDDDLSLASPSFAVTADDGSGKYRPPLEYLRQLNLVPVTATSGADRPFADYCDIICQQVHLTDISHLFWEDDRLDPFVDGGEQARDFVISYYEPFQDRYNPGPSVPGVLYYGEEKPWMSIEIEYMGSASSNNRYLSLLPVLFDARNKQIDGSSEQPLCRFAVRSSYMWDLFDNQGLRRAVNTQALLLNETQPTSLYEGGANGYDRGYHRLTQSEYPDPWTIPGSGEAYDYVFFEDATFDRYVHCFRSVSNGPEGDEPLYMELDLSDNDRVNTWDGNGYYFDRDVNGVADYVTFHPGETDSMMLMVEEDVLVSMPPQKHQGIQLWKGWNLVSFNINQDPDPISNPWLMPEIFGNQTWFDMDNSDGVTDEVYTFQSAVDHYPTYTGSGTWPWIMERGYMIYMQNQHLLELADDDWYPAGTLTFTPDPAWDDSLDETLPLQFQHYDNWFFLGFSKSRQIEVLPSNEAQGPFFDLYDLSGINYGNQTLKVVKSDDGRVFLPNYDAQGHDYDRIGYLEPGRGYSLGFQSITEVAEWPFCGTYDEEWVDPGENDKDQASQNSIASSDPSAASSTIHFQYKARTQWWYPILIDTFAIEDVIPEVGDEIGVFDGDHCVGAVAYQAELPLMLAAWKDDIATLQEMDGYIANNDMIFKFYDKSENQEIVFELPPTTLALADDPIAPRHSGFGVGFYAIRSLTEGIQSVNQLPQEYQLGQNYPNPFNAQTIIPIALPQRSEITVSLYNLMGQQVATVYEGIQNAGQAKLLFDASFLASGVYFYRVEATGLERGGKFVDTAKMVMIK